MRLSLRYRLLIPLALLLAGIAAASAWTANEAAKEAERRTAEQLWAVARTLTVPPTFPMTEPVLNHMKGFSGAEFLLLRPDGSRVGTFPDPLPTPPMEVPIAEADAQALGWPVTVAGNEYRCLRIRLRPPHREEGATLFIFYPEELRRSAIREAARPPLIIGALGGLVAIVLSLATGSSLVRRIRTLEQRTRLIAAGEFQPMPLPRADDELRDLCQSVNDMAKRLADFEDVVQRTERLRLVGQFSGGLAHQLRNAATGARLTIEVYLAENPAADPEPLQVALRQLDRIERNLRQFLDVGPANVTAPKPCDLASLIEQTVTLARPQAQHLGTALVWSAPPQPMPFLGDANSLSHLFTNVIGNALEAAGPGGSVEVKAWQDGTAYRIEVSDTGPGPPEAIANKLFEPFVTGKAQGVGLGLSVAKQAVEAHQGSLRWERNEGRTLFTIELPIATDLAFSRNTARLKSKN